MIAPGEPEYGPNWPSFGRYGRVTFLGGREDGLFGRCGRVQSGQGSVVVPKVSYQSWANEFTACTTSGAPRAALEAG